MKAVWGHQEGVREGASLSGKSLSSFLSFYRGGGHPLSSPLTAHLRAPLGWAGAEEGAGWPSLQLALLSSRHLRFTLDL